MSASYIHTNSTTTVRQRAAVQSAKSSGFLDAKEVAKSLSTSLATIYKWAQRTDPENRRSGPKNRPGFAWNDELIGAVLFFRSEKFSAVEIEQALKMDEMSLAPSSSTIHRRLVKLGQSRLLVAPKRVKQDFMPEPVGYLHVDLFYLPDIYGRKRYCMVVIERATKMIYTEILPDRCEETVSEAFGRAADFYPCRIHTVLSDNGAEFGAKGRAEDQTLGTFDTVCHGHKIKHKRTRPATPQTNGMVERMNGLTKESTNLAEPEEWQRLCPSPSFHEIFEAERTKTPLPRQQLLPTPVVLHLALWMAFWNEVRPNRTIKWQTPLEKMQDLYKEELKREEAKREKLERGEPIDDKSKDEPIRFLRAPEGTIKDLDRLNSNLGGQRLSFHCSYKPLKRAFFSTSLWN